MAKEKIFDDLAKLAGGTISVLSGLQGEIKEEIRAYIDELALKFDLVPREDFEKLEALLKQAREDQANTNKRLEALEKKVEK